MLTDFCNNDSDSSDGEFWSNLEKKQEIAKPKEYFAKERLKFASLRPNEKERYERTITNIRDSKEEEMRNLKIKIRNKTRKELFASVNELKKKYQEDALQLQQTFANSRSIIQKKDFEILQLISKVEEQELIITSMRVTFDRAKKMNLFPQDTSDINLRKQLEIYQLQLQSMALLFDELKIEVNKFKEKNEKLIAENKNLKQIIENNKQEIVNFSNETSEKLIKENENTINEFNRYKIEAEKEIEIREVLNKRQSQIIISLQDELKNAKVIINTPRIHYKAVERLKDITENNDSEKKMQRLNQTFQQKYVRNIKAKLPANYSYKEYKVFSDEGSKTTFQSLRASSITPKLDFYRQNNSKLSSSTDSKPRLSKNSILYCNNAQEA